MNLDEEIDLLEGETPMNMVISQLGSLENIATRKSESQKKQLKTVTAKFDKFLIELYNKEVEELKLQKGNPHVEEVPVVNV